MLSKMLLALTLGAAEGFSRCGFHLCTVHTLDAHVCCSETNNLPASKNTERAQSMRSLMYALEALYDTEKANIAKAAAARREAEVQEAGVQEAGVQKARMQEARFQAGAKDNRSPRSISSDKHHTDL